MYGYMNNPRVYYGCEAPALLFFGTTTRNTTSVLQDEAAEMK